jgi:CubicO group peptidase (beta-lactamase class C family)
MDADALRRAFGLLEGWVGESVVPGTAALVARHGKVAGTCYIGMADPYTNRPVDAATVFSLASITKPVTATAVMQGVERGWFALDEPVGALLPEFLAGPASGRDAADRTTVTVRHLLTHTSGLPGFSVANMRLRRRHAPLADFVYSFQAAPLFFAPGTAHLYRLRE